MDANELLLGDGGRLEFDQLVWTAGSSAVAALAGSDLPRDRRGFALVESTLQVRDHPSLLAAGDCATLADFPELPKAGVYAVRQGPVLAFTSARCSMDACSGATRHSGTS